MSKDLPSSRVNKDSHNRLEKKDKLSVDKDNNTETDKHQESQSHQYSVPLNNPRDLKIKRKSNLMR